MQALDEDRNEWKWANQKDVHEINKENGSTRDRRDDQYSGHNNISMYTLERWNSFWDGQKKKKKYF